MEPRIGFINEGVHGHPTVQARIARLLGTRTDIESWFATIPQPGGVEAVLVRRVDRFGDLDLQPLRWRLRYSWWARRLALRHPGTDAVVVQTQASALLARRLMRESAWILVVDATSRQFARLEYWRPRNRFSAISESGIEALERRAYRGADAVVAYSEWTARSLREEFGVGGDRIVVLHPGVVLPGAEHIARPGRESEALRVLFVGNDVERKGLAILRAALPCIGAPVHLAVVTHEDVPEAPGVTVHRRVAPESEELRCLYAAASVFVAPTLADCTPLAIVEAMAAGLPVISTAVGAVPELLGETGIIVPPGDVDALARAVRRLNDDPALRSELGRRAAARARDRFDWRRQTDRLVDLVRGTAERRRGGPARGVVAGP